MARVPLKTTLCLAIGTLTAAARADVSVGLSAPGCAVDASALAERLTVELPSILGGAVQVTASDDAAIQLTLACTPASADLVVARRSPPAHAERELRLADVDASMQPRAIADAAAELLRQLDVKPPPSLVVVDDPAFPEPTAAPASPRPRDRVPLYRGLTIGLGAVAVAAAAASLLLDPDDLDGHDGDVDARGHHRIDDDAASDAALGVGAVALVGTAVAFYFWMHERARAETPVVGASPIAHGGAVSLSLHF